MRIHIAIATTGRPSITRQVVRRLSQQTRRPDGVIVVGASRSDVAGLEGSAPNLEVTTAERGLCKQRNAALDRLKGKCDVVVFFDDDFVPANDYLAALEDMLTSEPEVIGLTGELVADGARTSPIAFCEAATRLDMARERPQPVHRKCTSLYGCNMAFRLQAAEGLRFDETLPLYGWQEDVDFTHQLSWRGDLIHTSRITGIHMGARSGKTSGRRLGYSQVANIVYLRRKGTLQPWHGEELLLRNLMANAVKSIRPEPDVDRRGRLAGNLLALADLVRGRIDPRRIELL
ncbi:glycosyltransferase [Altererythrobacter soli]|uniref:Glycosyltransferase n=1 Tax=Croceibacterium soli TaxID=1739690 RepID=A0A6I4URE2_9SPHN|nr:glycosyltransferase [Croceibacterium soli]MXP41361.1 glycosyltransferase [Croceibacterium soli]